LIHDNIRAIKEYASDVARIHVMDARVEEVGVADPARLPASVETSLYRIVQEALGNASRHAAGAGVMVTVTGNDDHLLVEVADTGPGFDPAAAEGSETHLGLVGMRERAESLGGQFRIESAPGHGTRARATLPLGTVGGHDG
jgi:signal transduction histidine kinase